MGSQVWCYVDCGHLVFFCCGMETYGVAHILPVMPSCHAWGRAHHHVTNSGLPCRGKACGCFVSDLCPFCQESQPECTLWTLRCSLLGAQAAFLLLVTAVLKKNQEWESWVKSPAWCNGSTAGGTAGLLQRHNGKMREEKKSRENRRIKRKSLYSKKASYGKYLFTEAGGEDCS